MKRILSSLCLALAVSACGADLRDDVPVEIADADLAGALGGNQDVRVIPHRGYEIVALGDDAAMDLWDVMENAGGFAAEQRGALSYLSGSYLACVSNGAAAACHVYTDGANEDEPGFLATFYGLRFQSAASEVFGAIARANGTAPADVSYVESDRLVCSKDSTYVGCGVTEAPEEELKAELEVSLAGLEPLGADYVYEGWLIVDGQPLPAGRFDLDGGDTVTFEFDAALRDTASMYVLTIEPAFGDDPAPSMTHVVAGAFDGDMAMLDVSHPAALGDDFSGAMGTFILATPSSDMDGTGTQGVWFLDPTAGPGPSLDLPRLPAGWAYEGWVVGEDGPVSTGRFTDPAMADSDGKGPAAGPNGAPPFPGQDFIDPAMDLTGAAVVLSIEPEPDNSPAPFAFKPLVNMMAEGVVGEMQMLNNQADTLATGVASWK